MNSWEKPVFPIFSQKKSVFRWTKIKKRLVWLKQHNLLTMSVVKKAKLSEEEDELPPPRKALEFWTPKEVRDTVEEWAIVNAVDLADDIPDIEGSFLVGDERAAVSQLRQFFSTPKRVDIPNLLAYLKAKASPPSPPSRPLASVVNEVLSPVTWPSRTNVRVLAPIFVPGCIHAGKSSAKSIVAAPTKPDRPSLLLYRLGTKFVKGLPLIRFNAVNDKQMCTVLLAPSGAGKTRKVFELLHEKLGYFIPFKLKTDKNYGSCALSSVLTLLENDPKMDWKNENPSALDYEARRTRATFAFYCVLIAFTEVFRGWEAKFKSSKTDSTLPFKWLLLQLFPAHFLMEDYMELLATELYKSCDPEEVLNYGAFYKDFYCVIDEGQMLETILRDSFLSTRPLDRNSKGLRPMCPILRGVLLCIACPSLPDLD
jgi:hypothetical protein